MIPASIPSPSSGTIELGPLNLTAYGLMIALGVVAAVWLTQRRWAAHGGDPEDIVTIAMWAVPAGLIGARLYHVMTDWQRFRGEWLDVVKIWEGGLGIPGGIALGTAVGLMVARRQGMRIPVILDAAAPALPLAQAIGRWGNWWNQELFGGPTDLPWGLEIDPSNRPAEHLDAATFHPTVLYESLWNLALVALLLYVDRRGLLRRGYLFALYVFGYGVGRLAMELLRVDEASLLLGVRVNVWMSLALIIGGGAFVVRGWMLAARDRESGDPTDRNAPYDEGRGPSEVAPGPLDADAPATGRTRREGRSEQQ
ncbi:MAG TPA: prolipoprotein diacylglyceryl transferase [Acidimicrobiales bacterium]|nr:prolipoprotein diacylglyceryl transferase [Acidimicrobiales bacterium]